MCGVLIDDIQIYINIFFYYDISICSAEKGKGNSRMEHIFDER
jgi:hypothetical protein